METDGWEKYAACVALIKDTLAPRNPQENEKAYIIEDVVNKHIADMFEELEKRFA